MSCVIPILPDELFQYETYERIVGVMDYMEKLFDTTMDCVAGRISECKSKVDSLSYRISTARNRISQAKGSSRALNIFSSPSFPKLENQDDQLLPSQKPMPRYHPTVHETEHPGQAPRGNTSDVTMLHSLYMKLKVPTPSMLDLPQQHKEIGLGASPEDISNASTFLLFNSHSNPYNMDFTEIAPEKKQTLNDRTVSVNLPEAPKTMQEADDFSKFGKKDFVYQPDTKETPKVDLPSQLNIPGIANLDWDDDEDDDFSSGFSLGGPKSVPSSAPSGSSSKPEPPQEKMPALPSLPSIGDKSAPSAPAPASKTLTTAPPQSKAPPPPPPPPPQSRAPPPPPAPPSQSRAPPPPPPPPSGKAPPPPPPPKEAPSNLSAGGRGEMLAAIRARQENPLAGLKKTETLDKSAPAVKGSGGSAAASGKKDPFSLLKEQIGLRFNAIHAPAVSDKSIKKPAIMTEAKKGHDSDSYSD